MITLILASVYQSVSANAAGISGCGMHNHSLLLQYEDL